MSGQILCAGRTDVGRKRDSNQDQFLIADLIKSILVQSTSLDLAEQCRMYGTSHGKLLMVADGMGGHLGGQRASTLAIDMLIHQLLNSMHWFFQFDAAIEDRERRFIEDLKRIMQLTHEEIEKESQQTQNKGMGTTLTMAYIIGNWMYVVHAGDSRCYLLRGNELRQLTTDHTVLQQLVNRGGMSATEAGRSPWSNVLYNALGAGGSSVSTDVQKAMLYPGDSILLCSDGLNRHLADREILELLQSGLDPSATCNTLVDLVNSRGGQDNVTVIVANILDPNNDLPNTTTHVRTNTAVENLPGETMDTPTTDDAGRDTDEHKSNATRSQ